MSNYIFLCFITYMFIHCDARICFNIPNASSKKSDYSFVLTNPNTVKDSFQLYEPEEKVTLFGRLNDCNGALTFTLIDSTKKIVIKGAFINGLDILKRQVNELDNANGSLRVITENYIEPLRTGLWTYNTFSGKRIREDKYAEGIALDK